MVPQTQNGVLSTSCGNGIFSKTVLLMKIDKFRYFPKIETDGKESVVNVQNSSETGCSNALTVIIFLVKAYS